VLATLEHWLAEKWPKLAVRHATTLELTSPQSGKAVVLEPQPPRFTSDEWYERNRRADTARRWQLLLRPTAGVLRVRDEVADGTYATRLYGLASVMVTHVGLAIVVNPQAQLVGTITSRRLALDSGLATDRHADDGRLIIEPLAVCKLSDHGVRTPAALRVLEQLAKPPAPRRVTFMDTHGVARASAPPAFQPRSPVPRVERLPEVAPGTVATEGMDDDTRWAIFQQAKRRSRQTPS
jgi:rRNA maturation protein Nop10